MPDDSKPDHVIEPVTQTKKRGGTGETEFPAAIAALALLAALRTQDRFSDENDNEAQRQSDGSVRLSIKQKDGGHLRVFVRVPELVSLIVVDAPKED